MNTEKAFDMDAPSEDSAPQTGGAKSREISLLASRHRESSPGASDVDALVSEFLGELDVVSATLSISEKPSPAPVVERVRALESIESSRGIRAPAALRIAQEADPAASQFLAGDLDAELARTLHELESRPKSNVIPLTVRDPARLQPPNPLVQERTSRPEAFPSQSASTISATTAGTTDLKRETRAISQGTVSRPPAPNVARPPLSKTASAQVKRVARSRNPWAGRGVAIGIAALALIALSIAGFYYFFPLQSSTPGAVATAPPLSNPGSTSPGADTNVNVGTTQTTQDKKETSDGTQSSVDTKLVAGNTPDRRVVLPVPNQAPGIAGQAAASSLATAPAAGNAALAQPPPARPAMDRSGSVDARTVLGQPAAVRTDTAPPANTNTVSSAPPLPATSAPGSVIKNTIDTPPAPPQIVQQPPPQTAGSGAATDAPPAGTSPPPIPATPVAAEPTMPPSKTASSDADSGTATPKGASPPLAIPAEPLIRVVPQYPSVASRLNAKGRVELTVEVDERGNVVRAKAVSGPLVLRAAAEEALMKWRFKPATLRGVNVKSEVNIYVDFNK